MFESVRPDAAQDALIRTSRVLRVLAIVIVLGTLYLALPVITEGRSLRWPLFLFNLALAGVAWVAAIGVDAAKAWGTWAAIFVAILELLNFPFGTIVGIALLVYLVRARRAPRG